MSDENGGGAPSETLTYATPEEVVEFVERVRYARIDGPPQSAKIVAIEKVDGSLTRSKCEWENCSSPSTGQYRWRREAADGVNDAFDKAVYCEGHGAIASTHGAVLLERFGGGGQ